MSVRAVSIESPGLRPYRRRLEGALHLMTIRVLGVRAIRAISALALLSLVSPLVAVPPPSPAALVPSVLVNAPAADATAQDTQSTTALTLGATASTVVVAFNDTGSFTTGGNQATGWARSTDGGATFLDRGTLPASAGGDGGNPSLVRSPRTGTLVLATSDFARGPSLPVFRSTDDGATFLAPLEGAPGYGASDGLDRVSLAVDPVSAGGQAAGYGNLYAVYRNTSTLPARDGISISRSTDDGLTWAVTGGGVGTVLGAKGQGASVVVGADHAVYAFWLDTESMPRKHAMRKSTDQGVSFGPVVSVAVLSNGLDLGLGFRSQSAPLVATHPVTPSLLFCAYADQPALGDRADVFLKTSTDGGATWGAAVRVNADPGTNDQWGPVLAVAPDGSRLFVSWYDRRNDVANSRFDLYAAVGTVAGSTVTLGPNFILNDAPIPTVVGQDPALPPDYMGDYDGASATATHFVRTWGDNRGASPSHTKQPDVRFARIAFAGPGIVLRPGAPLVSGGNGNAALDPSECAFLAIPIENAGTATATAITGTLSAVTPGVVVSAGTGSWGTLAPGASGPALVPFALTVPALSCGTPVDLQLTLSSGGDVFVYPIRVPTGSGTGTSQRVDFNTQQSIPDANATGLEVPFSVSGAGTVAKVTLSLYLTHAYDEDLLIRLVSPAGTTVDLSRNRGGSGDNYGSACAPDGNRVTFDDAALVALVDGVPPFVGSFRPDSPLSAFAGEGLAGTWKLKIVDSVSGDAGVLRCASLVVTPVACAPASACNLVAQCGATPSTGAAPLSVSFGAVASGGSGTYTYSWAFGDGGLSTSQAPTHVFNTGSHMANLTVNDGANTATCSQAITATGLPGPAIGSVSPVCGTFNGGTSVVVNGTGFVAGSLVTVGGTNAPVTNFTPTALTVTAPAGTWGPANVVVTNPDLQTSTRTGGYRYVVRGDANGTGTITPADTIYLNLAVFLGGSPVSCPVEGDANGNGAITPADSIYLTLFVFLGGAPPPP